MPRQTLGLLLGFVGVLIFGATLPMTRIAVAHLDPWFVTTGRAVVAGAAALVLLVVLRRPVPPPFVLVKLAAAAALLVFGFPGFSAFAMRSVPAAHGGVVLGILPLATAVIGAVFTRDRPPSAFWLWAVAGAAIVVVFSLRQGGGHVEPGDLLLIGAIASAATGYVISAQLTRTMPGWEVISWAVVLALPATIPVTWLHAPPLPAEVPWQAWGAFLYLGLMSQYIGFFAWNAGLALGGVARVSQVQLLQTFVTLSLASLLAGEPLEPLTWLAALAVVATVLLGRKAGARR
jgi:drug/metabolite transporter (DMT)-like permease